jgi:hypothetical protein
MDLGEIGQSGMDWIGLAQDGPVKRPYECGSELSEEFLSGCSTISTLIDIAT